MGTAGSLFAFGWPALQPARKALFVRRLGRRAVMPLLVISCAIGCWSPATDGPSAAMPRGRPNVVPVLTCLCVLVNDRHSYSTDLQNRYRTDKTAMAEVPHLQGPVVTGCARSVSGRTADALHYITTAAITPAE
jgi:hypothetical protein